MGNYVHVFQLFRGMTEILVDRTQFFTRPETSSNFAAENQWSEDHISLWNGQFSVGMASLLFNEAFFAWKLVDMFSTWKMEKHKTLQTRQNPIPDTQRMVYLPTKLGSLGW